MEHISGEKHNRVVFRIDQMGVSAPVVDNEAAALKLPRPRMKIVDTRQTALPVGTSGIRITVFTKEGAVVVCLTEKLERCLTGAYSESALQQGNDLREATKKLLRGIERSPHAIECRTAASIDSPRPKLVASFQQVLQELF